MRSIKRKFLFLDEIIRNLFFLWLLVLLGVSCGAGSNFLKLFTASEQKDTWDSQIALAQIYYDTLDFDKALKHAERAYELNPDSERAAVLLGYVYMAKTGLSPFSVVEKLTAKETKDDESDEGGENQSEQPASDSGQGNNSNSSGDKGGFGVLSGIIGLSDDDFGKMGVINQDVAHLPVIEPACAGEARETVETLKYANLAVKVICKFVDSDIRLSEDQRHDCQSVQSGRQQQAEAHFLWALAHLTEAAAFHGVVNYGTTSSEKSNLELRVEEFKNIDISDPSQIPLLVQNLESLTQTIDKVLQVSGFCSEQHPQTQLMALVNDLIAITYAFSKMPGIPEGMTQSISSAAERIVAIREQTSGVARTRGQAEAAKGGLTKSISKGVAKILDSANPGQFDAEQVDSLCSSYGNISAGGAGGDDEIPDICE